MAYHEDYDKETGLEDAIGEVLGGEEEESETGEEGEEVEKEWE